MLEPNHEGKPIHDGQLEAVKRIDYSRAIDGGPLACGFDQFFGTACCPTTDWLYAYIDGNRIQAKHRIYRWYIQRLLKNLVRSYTSQSPTAEVPHSRWPQENKSPSCELPPCHPCFAFASDEQSQTASMGSATSKAKSASLFFAPKLGCRSSKRLVFGRCRSLPKLRSTLHPSRLDSERRWLPKSSELWGCRAPSIHDG